MLQKSLFFDEAVSLLQAMVQIDSTNGREEELAKFMRDWFSSNDMQTYLQPVHGPRMNSWGWFGDWSWEERSRVSLKLLFHGHIDTVPVYSMDEALSGKIIDDGKLLWGRGSVDQKGGLAAVMMAMKLACKRLSRKPECPFGLVGVVDEESEHRGSYQLAKEGVKAEYGLSCEPSNLDITVGVKGTYPLKIVTHGVSVHGSQPEKGVNAIQHMCRIIEALDTIRFKEVDLGKLGKIKGTLNVGLIKGGQAYNIVPNYCEVFLDRRLVPGEEPSESKQQIEEVITRLTREIPSFDAEVSVSRPDWKWPPIIERGLKPAQTPQDTPLLLILEKIAEEVLGHKPRRVYETGYSDMDFLINDLGIPSVEFGPGELELCHSDREALDLNQFARAIQIYHELILRLNSV
ncbi:MAG: M20 family metallopeptidase [Candidatus Ranarchaeia archaeon]